MSTPAPQFDISTHRLYELGTTRKKYVVPIEIADELTFLHQAFVLGQRQHAGQPQYVLWAPDSLETRWAVYDRQAKRSISFGATAREAVQGGVAIAGVPIRISTDAEEAAALPEPATD